jgi:hypothetical protein
MVDMSSSSSSYAPLPSSATSAAAIAPEGDSSSLLGSSSVGSASEFGASPSSETGAQPSSESGPSGLFSGTDGVLIAGKGKVGKGKEPGLSIPTDLLDFLQLSLDIAGIFPGLGEGADVLNAVISAARGDYIGAALSLVSCIPGAGDAVAKPIKIALKAGHVPAKKAAELLGFLAQHSAKLQKDVLGGMKGRIPGADKYLVQISQLITKALDDLRKRLFEALKVGVQWTAHDNKHVPELKGMANWAWDKIVKNTGNGKAAMYKPGTNVQELEHIAFHTGLKDTTGRPFKVLELPHVVGASSGKETKYMRVEYTEQNVIHGHPIDYEEFLMRTK